MASSRFDLRFVLVPLVVFLVHAASRNITSSDSIWTVHTARSILSEFDVDLDEYEGLLARERFRDTISLDGHRYYQFPIGTPLVAVPFVLAVDVALDVLVPAVPPLAEMIQSRTAEGIGSFDSIGLYKGVELLTASFLVALAALLVYASAGRVLGRGWLAVLVTFVFAFCTPAWSTASRALWSHTTSMLSNAAAIALFLPGGSRPFRSFAAGALLAFGFVLRATNAIPAAVFAVYVFLEHRKALPRFLLGAVVVAALFLAFDRLMYGMWLPSCYSPARGGHPWFFGIALAGNLISPNRGLFVFCPFLLFGLYGAVKGLAGGRNRRFWAALALIPVLHWVVISMFPLWYGGLGYGQRYFTEMMPYLVFLLVPFLEAASSPGFRWKVPVWAVFSLLVLAGFLIHMRGACDWDTYVWVDQPRNLDVYPSRVWDWGDMQILRGL